MRLRSKQIITGLLGGVVLLGCSTPEGPAPASTPELNSTVTTTVTTVVESTTIPEGVVFIENASFELSPEGIGMVYATITSPVADDILEVSVEPSNASPSAELRSSASGKQKADRIPLVAGDALILSGESYYIAVLGVTELPGDVNSISVTVVLEKAGAFTFSVPLNATP